MDDLVTDSVIIENLNLIVKLDNQRVRVAFSRVSRGSDPSRASSVDDDSGGYKMIKGVKSCSLIPFTKLLSSGLLLHFPLLKS